MTFVFRLAYLLLMALPAASSCTAGELGGLLHAALDHPTVKSAHLQAEAARAQKEAVTSRYFGSAVLSYGWHHYEGQRVVGIFVPSGPPALLSDKIAQSGLSYSLPIDLFGTISASGEKATQDLAAAKLQVEQQSLLKLHQTATAYYSLQALLAQQAALEIYRKQTESTYRRIKTEVALGKTAQVEAKYAESEITRLAADEDALQGAIHQYQAELEEATGNADFLPKRAVPHIPEWRNIASAAALPPKIAEARQASARAYAKEGRRSLLPSISLDASYYDNAIPGGDDRKTWMVGGVISIPLNAQQYRQAQSRAFSSEAASAQSQAVLRETERQLAELRITYDSALADGEAMEKEATYLEQVVSVQREMQRLGSQTLENLFRHERDLLDARYRLAQAQAKAASAWSAAQAIAGTSPETYISKVDIP